MISRIEVKKWKDYELIDTGNNEKLERYGQYILRRPEPQSIWKPSLNPKEWEKLTDAAFFKEKKTNTQKNESSDKGQWFKSPKMPEQWYINYTSENFSFKVRLGMTSFKHIGIFPEQSYNWEYIHESIKLLNKKQPIVLNLFAYTGIASIVASLAGAKVVHVDSVKQVINWASQNASLNNINNISWIVDDAVKFVNREIRRNKKYDAIILDPPAYGRGPDGEKWLLNEHLFDLLVNCQKLLVNDKYFVVLNLYSLGYSPIIAYNLLKNIFVNENIEAGELFFKDNYEKMLPLGIFARFRKL